MHETILTGSKTGFPAPADPDAAALGWERLAEATADESADLGAFIAGLATDETARAALDGVFGNSSFLCQCSIAEPGQLRRVLLDGPDSAFDEALRDLDASLAGDAHNEDHVARHLRIAKRRIALTIALADIWHVWDLERVTGALSEFARRAISHAARHAIAEAAAAGAFRLANTDDAERGSGYVILAMGKLGAGELNYSSDIDLITLFDRDIIDTDDEDRLQNRMVRVTRTLARLLDIRTADGYVFRTDLRLRPDPGSTPLAISVLAAENYYESLGQNWERAAMIKARAVAGDIEAGERFLAHLTPFVWRKSLDFAAIQDIHSIKRQIHARAGGDAIRGPGHNIKTGVGGIREIEFFMQTQQLIWGGREPALRTRRTLEALDALVDLGKVGADVAQDMAEAYRFLRRVEHRLQMIADEQTQTLPEDPVGFRRLALFLGYDDAETFERKLLHTLETVRGHYTQLYGDAPSLGAETGNLMFTGIEADPETLKSLAEMGFGEPATVDAAVRGWHHGRMRATRSTRAREILTELMPVLLQALGRQPDADAAFTRFDEFLAGLPSGVQLFSLFQAAPHLLGLVADIMGEAPRLAEQLSRRPSMLDAVLDPGFMTAPPGRAELLDEFNAEMARCDYVETALDAARRWNHDRRFQVGVQILEGEIAPPDAARAMTDIADVVLEGLYPVVAREFAEQHGGLAESEIAVLALGKLGSRELTATSDLDLVFVYRAPDGLDSSDGDKPLPPSQYHIRLCQRFITALTALTAEGTMYDVDMRLRPNGKASPAATPFDGFSKYYTDDAWTWEYMTLTRARVVFGSPELAADIEAIVKQSLTAERDADKLLADVANMRRRMAGQHQTDCLWSLKHLRGGLVDIDFMAQYLALCHARDHPDLLAGDSLGILLAARDAGLIPEDDGATLIEALKLWRALQGFLAVTVASEIRTEQEESFAQSLKDDLARIGDAEDFDRLKQRVADLVQRVRDIYDALIERPATALPAPGDETDTQGPEE